MASDRLAQAGTWLVWLILLKTDAMMQPTGVEVGFDLKQIGAAVLLLWILRVLIAVGILLLGIRLARVVQDLVASWAAVMPTQQAMRIAHAFSYGTLLVAILVALGTLGLHLPLLEHLILLAVAGLALTFALAVGVGSRDIAAGVLAGYYVRRSIHPGDDIFVAGMRGTVREIGPIVTTVETKEEGLLHRRNVPNTVILREAVR